VRKDSTLDNIVYRLAVQVESSREEVVVVVEVDVDEREDKMSGYTYLIYLDLSLHEKYTTSPDRPPRPRP
jgi:hypothetical protein